MEPRPIVGITCGDPAGIGPEIVVRAVGDPRVQAACRPLVIGDPHVVALAAQLCGGRRALRVVDGLERRETPPLGAEGPIEVVAAGELPPGSLRWGLVQAAAGQAAFAYVERAVQLAFAGTIDALATAPLHKVALRQAAVPYLGHTEMLAGLTGAHEPLTMFEAGALRIFFLTRHVSLRRACELVERERVLDVLLRAERALDRLKLPAGPLAVAALNPHGGEDGLLGCEEREQLEPAIAEARARGCAIEGPIPADAVFHQARQGRFRAVLALYHDQGHIAAKTLDFEHTVALTLGLPFLRTSVDHGTAFDLAGQGRASATSMIEAVLAAARYAGGWRHELRSARAERNRV
ncbi:MAG: 4-hydroxythreonine-4-phosphate dehydrogenase PdxA [Proteobacteria bacterium]|nr:4-hydroxythreonine-4-phosphate dehydrogenase PdxA [Pseudomonadota bacterium]